MMMTETRVLKRKQLVFSLLFSHFNKMFKQREVLFNLHIEGRRAKTIPSDI